MQEINETELSSITLQCHHCGWKGNGLDAAIIDFYGLVPTKEIRCPECNEKLGEMHKTTTPKGTSGDQLSNQIG